MLPATGLRTHSWNTAIRSVVLLAGFPFLLAMMGYALALLLVAADAPSVRQGLRDAARLLPAIIPLALLLAAVWFAIAWAAHNRILDLVTGAKRVADPRDEPRLWHLTEALCISRGMTMPRLAVIETPSRNAFATGISRGKSGVTVTRGLMDALDDRELSAVIGHELSHIRNGDARLGVIAAVFVGVITLVTDGVWQMLRFGGRRGVRYGYRGSRSSSRSSSGKDGGGLVMLALIAIAVVIAVLAHMLALVLRMALSRNREYLADAGAVEMTQDADAMISALRKVEQRPDMPRVPEQVRALFLHDAALARGPGWFATHPPVDQRIAALVRYGGGHDPGRLPPIEEPAPIEGVTEEAAAPTPPWSPAAQPAQERPWAWDAPLSDSPDAPRTPVQEWRDAARREGRSPDDPPSPRPWG